MKKCTGRGPLRIGETLRIYPLLPPAVRKRRTNETAPVCVGCGAFTATVNSDYLVAVSSNGREEVMRYHFWRYIA